MSETAIAIMIVWFGVGQYAQFDVERFDSLVECEAARVVLLADTDKTGWGVPQPDQVRCHEVHR